jgi:putative flippase GtrA
MLFNPPLKVIAQFFAILAGTVFNYIGSKFFVFIKIKEKEPPKDESQE